jgi:hypothetical protein
LRKVLTFFSEEFKAEGKPVPGAGAVIDSLSRSDGKIEKCINIADSVKTSSTG